jgi:hypothetical protein
VTRLARLVLLGCLASVLGAAAATAAPRMYVGFQDDAGFRYRNDRDYIFLRAKNVHATVLLTTLDWAQVAPARPGNAANPFDPGYRLEGIDEFVRKAQEQGLEPMLRVYGTPRWAGPAKNRLPRRLGDLTAFTRAMATRYSGRYAGYPFVRFWTVWNEPNLNQFLSPQFDRKGRSVSPRLYASLYRAAYAGIKLGSPTALVGMGETSMRGRDRRVPGQQDTHSPGHFLELLSKVRPAVRFDAIGHHPYPTDPRQSPDQVVRWPNVSLRLLPRLELSVNKWFKRTSTRIWVTEYGHETVPDPRGVSFATQSAYVQRALTIVRGYPYVDMFIWFTLHDDAGNPWQSGLIAQDETVKPGFYTWASWAFPLDPRNPILTVKAGLPNPVVKIAARELAARNPVGSRVGVDERVILGDSLIAHPTPEGTLGFDAMVTVPIQFTPEAGRTYYVQVDMNTAAGVRVTRFLTLLARA